MNIVTDTSEETKAKVQQLKVFLQETHYDKYVSDQKKLLNELYNEYETILNQRLDDLNALIGDMIQDINDNSGMINNTLISKAESVGYELSDNMLNIWNSSSGTNKILTTSYQNVNENTNSMPDIIEKPVVLETSDDNKFDVTKSDSDIKLVERLMQEMLKFTVISEQEVLNNIINKNRYILYCLKKTDIFR